MEVESFIYVLILCMCMSSTNIAIKREAYEFLRSLKDRSKSFSDVILEFKEREFIKRGSKEAAMKSFGVLKDKGIDWKAKEEKMAFFRKEFEDRFR